MNFKSLALFCDDLRDEASGMQSLMGIWPDYVKLETPEGTTATLRMAIYVRTLVAVEEKPKDIEIFLHLGVEPQMKIASISADFISKTIEDARRGGIPNAGFINRVIATAFPIAASTLLTVIAKAGDREQICGAVSIELIYQPNISQQRS